MNVERNLLKLLTTLIVCILIIGVNPTIIAAESSNDDQTDDSSEKSKKSGKSEKSKKSDKDDSGIRVEICHFTGNGRAVLIDVSERSINAHINHGDFRPHKYWLTRFKNGSASAEGKVCQILVAE